ncbi:hypothetical protein, partial [Enterocloster lavalensis]|uniref:hypothetical protein n=1 Tax=Enterocloster lavalensis TaxID=460384 RepID=UPI0023F46863
TKGLQQFFYLQTVKDGIVTPISFCVNTKNHQSPADRPAAHPIPQKTGPGASLAPEPIKKGRISINYFLFRDTSIIPAFPSNIHPDKTFSINI